MPYWGAVHYINVSNEIMPLIKTLDNLGKITLSASVIGELRALKEVSLWALSKIQETIAKPVSFVSSQTVVREHFRIVLQEGSN